MAPYGWSTLAIVAALAAFGLLGLAAVLRSLTRTPPGVRLDDCVGLARSMHANGHPYEACLSFLVAQMRLPRRLAKRIVAQEYREPLSGRTRQG